MKKHNQQGISVTGFLTLLVVVGFVLFIGMKLFPMYSQFYSVKKALKGVATDSAVASDPISVRKALDKYFDVGYVDAIKSSDVKVDRNGANGTEISVDYEVRKPLVYNLDIVGRFKTTEIKHVGAQ